MERARVNRRPTIVSSVLLAAALLGLGGGRGWGAEGTSDPSPGTSAGEKPAVIVVLGAPGEEAFGEKFRTWGERWLAAARTGGATAIPIGFDPATATNSASQLRAALEAQPRDGAGDLWLVLIGHGTFDGRDARFNLVGSDITAGELSLMVKPFERRLAVVDCSSASGPFLNALSRTNRIVVVATKSGSEQNFTRYGDFLSAALTDPEADLDKDGQVSLLEAHLTASKRTIDFYHLEGRLATEHALIDDNGDGLGTPGDWFRGVRAVKKAKDGAEPDGLRAHQVCLIPNEAERNLPAAIRHRRDEIELGIARLRDRKSSMPEAAYYAELEPLLQELARLYASAEKPAGR